MLITENATQLRIADAQLLITIAVAKLDTRDIVGNISHGNEICCVKEPLTTIVCEFHKRVRKPDSVYDIVDIKIPMEYPEYNRSPIAEMDRKLEETIARMPVNSEYEDNMIYRLLNYFWENPVLLAKCVVKGYNGVLEFSLKDLAGTISRNEIYDTCVRILTFTQPVRWLCEYVTTKAFKDAFMRFAPNDMYKAGIRPRGGSGPISHDVLERVYTYYCGKVSSPTGEHQKGYCSGAYKPHTRNPVAYLRSAFQNFTLKGYGLIDICEFVNGRGILIDEGESKGSSLLDLQSIEFAPQTEFVNFPYVVERIARISQCMFKHKNATVAFNDIFTAYKHSRVEKQMADAVSQVKELQIDCTIEDEDYGDVTGDRGSLRAKKALRYSICDEYSRIVNNTMGSRTVMDLYKAALSMNAAASSGSGVPFFTTEDNATRGFDNDKKARWLYEGFSALKILVNYLDKYRPYGLTVQNFNTAIFRDMRLARRFNSLQEYAELGDTVLDLYKTTTTSEEAENLGLLDNDNVYDRFIPNYNNAKNPILLYLGNTSLADIRLALHEQEVSVKAKKHKQIVDACSRTISHVKDCTWASEESIQSAQSYYNVWCNIQKMCEYVVHKGIQPGAAINYAEIIRIATLLACAFQYDGTIYSGVTHTFFLAEELIDQSLDTLLSRKLYEQLTLYKKQLDETPGVTQATYDQFSNLVKYLLTQEQITMRVQALGMLFSVVLSEQDMHTDAERLIAFILINKSLTRSMETVYGVHAALQSTSGDFECLMVAQQKINVLEIKAQSLQYSDVQKLCSNIMTQYAVYSMNTSTPASVREAFAKSVTKNLVTYVKYWLLAMPDVMEMFSNLCNGVAQEFNDYNVGNTLEHDVAALVKTAEAMRKEEYSRANSSKRLDIYPCDAYGYLQKHGTYYLLDGRYVHNTCNTVTVYFTDRAPDVSPLTLEQYARIANDFKEDLR